MAEINLGSTAVERYFEETADSQPLSRAEEVALSARAVSLEDAPADEGDQALLNVLPDEREPLPDAHVLNESAIRRIDEELAFLDPDELLVLRLRFGLGGDDPLEYREVGDKLRRPVRPQRIHQIVNEAFTKLRRDPEENTQAAAAGG